jgi:subtilisin family serine protease
VQEYANNSVIVRFKSTARSASVFASGLQAADPVLSRSLAVSISARDGTLSTPSAISKRTNLYKITDGSSVDKKIAELNSLPDVALAEPNRLVTIMKTPSDRQYPYQWHLPKIAAPVAWDTATGSKKVKVCIIDSGARIDHPDLAANIIKGWNVLESPSDPKFYNFNDTLGHGTHVAGLAAAVGNNARGVSGVSWRMGLLICKFISDSGTGAIWDAIHCMRLCEDEGALIYSNSWGGLTTPDSLGDEIAALEASGGLFVVAAGNNGSNLDLSPRYPASYNAPNQVTVAATTPADTKAGFSDYGPYTVHIAAPGEGLLSTTNDGDYGQLSGTSMATPVVSGAAALLQSMALNAKGTPLTPSRLRSILMETVDPMIWGPSTVTSRGRLNVARAVAQLKAELGGYTEPPKPAAAVPTVPMLPQTARAPLSPPTSNAPSTNLTTTVITPECGTSALRGHTAFQSSVAESYNASNAINGDCRNDMSQYVSSCSATDPSLSHPWWTATLLEKSDVVAVSITTRADCCWNAIGGAIVYIGNGAWTGVESKASFTECSRVPAQGIPRGQRSTITCNSPIKGSSVAIYLPKIKTSLILCEVDVTLNDVGGGSIAALPAAVTGAARQGPSTQAQGGNGSKQGSSNRKHLRSVLHVSQS